jgi:ATP-dependent Clp protease ATP-binding subunit ClpB
MSAVLEHPIVALPASPREKLRGLESYLLSRIIGQDDAVHRVSGAVVDGELGLNDRGPRPKGAYLFMGPTGVGKTETTKAFTEFLFGHRAPGMFFMNEHQREASVLELVAGIRRTREQHPKGTVFLFDEIEKAHSAVIDVFLSLMDEGEVSDGAERIKLGDCYVVLTSNVGSKKFAQMEDSTYSVMEQFAFEAARRELRPEMFARLTETVVYRPLSQDVQVRILSQLCARKLEHLRETMAQQLGLDPEEVPPLSIDEKGVHAHLLRTAFSNTGGARRLRQELDRQFNHAVRPWLLDGVAPVEWRFRADGKRNCLVLL